MPKRSSKPPADENRAAFDVVRLATEANEDLFRVESTMRQAMQDLGKGDPEPKNPAAQALGRLGGLKGGKARAASMTPEQRKEVAKKAAETRWGKK